ncbi:Calmodulin-binding protein CRAG [Pelomyxa schiedti]|nr:Calmodulin-binding protein CRAG [Pelomyxa schiedti]
MLLPRVAEYLVFVGASAEPLRATISTPRQHQQSSASGRALPPSVPPPPTSPAPVPKSIALIPRSSRDAITNPQPRPATSSAAAGATASGVATATATATATANATSSSSASATAAATTSSSSSSSSATATAGAGTRTASLNSEETVGDSKSKPHPPEMDKGPFKGEVIDRLPVRDHSDFPLPPNLWILCFPHGIVLEHSAKVPKYFIFSGTSSNGARFYGNALTIFQSHNSAPGIFSPLCICIISRHHLFSTMAHFLTTIFQMLSSGESTPTFSLLQHIFFDMPLVSPGSIINCNFMSPNFSVTLPPCNYFSPYQMSFKTLFDCLGIRLAIDLIASILEEPKVLMLSKSHSLLTIVAETVISLLYPFSYIHVYAPTLGCSMWDYCHAPMPYFMGILTLNPNDKAMSALLQSISDQNQVVVLDLDSGEVIYGELKSTMSNTTKRDLIQSLHNILHPEMGQLESFKAPTVVNEDINELIRTVFLNFFVSLLWEFRSFLHTIRKYPKPTFLFDKEKFLLSQSLDKRPLVQVIVETQLFSHFLDSYYYHDKNLFDLAVRTYSSSSVLDLPSLQSAIKSQVDTEVSLKPTIALYHTTISSTVLLNPTSPLPRLSPELFESLSPTPPTPQTTTTKHVYHINGGTCEITGSDLISNDADHLVSSLFEPTHTLKNKNIPQMLSTNLHSAFCFCKSLVETLKQHKFSLSSDAFEILSQIIIAILDACNSTSDFRAAAELLSVIPLVTREINFTPEFMKTRVKNEAIWKSTKFWQFSLAYRMKSLRNPNDIGQCFFENDNHLSEEQRASAVAFELKAFDQVMVEQVSYMAELGVPCEWVQNYISSLGAKCFIPASTQQQLIALHENMTKFAQVLQETEYHGTTTSHYCNVHQLGPPTPSSPSGHHAPKPGPSPLAQAPSQQVAKPVTQSKPVEQPAKTLEQVRYCTSQEQDDEEIPPPPPPIKKHPKKVQTPKPKSSSSSLSDSAHKSHKKHSHPPKTTSINSKPASSSPSSKDLDARSVKSTSSRHGSNHSRTHTPKGRNSNRLSQPPPASTSSPKTPSRTNTNTVIVKPPTTTKPTTSTSTSTKPQSQQPTTPQETPKPEPKKPPTQRRTSPSPSPSPHKPASKSTSKSKSKPKSKSKSSHSSSSSTSSSSSSGSTSPVHPSPSTINQQPPSPTTYTLIPSSPHSARRPNGPVAGHHKTTTSGTSSTPSASSPSTSNSTPNTITDTNSPTQGSTNNAALVPNTTKANTNTNNRQSNKQSS